MTVEGYDLPEAIESAVLAEIRRRSGFKASEIVGLLRRSGVPTNSVRPEFHPAGPADRVADRLLQRERRAGRIRFEKGLWHRVPEASGDAAR